MPTLNTRATRIHELCDHVLCFGRLSIEVWRGYELAQRVHEHAANSLRRDLQERRQGGNSDRLQGRGTQALSQLLQEREELGQEGSTLLLIINAIGVDCIPSVRRTSAWNLAYFEPQRAHPLVISDRSARIKPSKEGYAHFGITVV